MQSVVNTLNRYGALGVQAIKSAVQKVSATGESAESVRYEVKGTQDKDTLRILARSFFSAIETGRGPRKSNEYQGFDNKMMEYMQARGIGSDLPEKKRKQLAKFLAYKINKEGDRTFKAGGRKVYSPVVDKLVDEIRQAVRKDIMKFALLEIRNGVQQNKAA